MHVDALRHRRLGLASSYFIVLVCLPWVQGTVARSSALVGARVRTANPFTDAVQQGAKETVEATKEAVANVTSKTKEGIDKTANRTKEAATNVSDAAKALNISQLPSVASKGAGAVGDVARQSAQDSARVAGDGAREVGATARTAGTNVTGSIGTALIPGSLGPNERIVGGGFPTTTVNFCALAIVVFFLLAAVAGNTFEKLDPAWSTRHACPTQLVLALLLVSYALLIPGIASPLFAMNCVVNVQKYNLRIGLTSTENGESAPLVESMADMFFELLGNGGVVGASLLVLYAMVVPLLKLLLIFLAERWRQSGDVAMRQRAKTCVQAVQVVSKWASPDMFAYILLYCLFRGLDEAPDVTVVTHLDVGFTCFCAFSLCSTVASLLLEVPEADSEPPPVASGRVLNVCLSVASAVCLVLGVCVPCMALHTSERMVTQNIKTPFFLRPLANDIVHSMALEERLSADVSILQCLGLLFRVAQQTGEANACLGFCLLAINVVALPLVGLALILAEPTLGAVLLGPARVLRHLAMLDVFVMGIIVVTMASAPWRKHGMVLSLQPGLVLLLLSQLGHWGARWLPAARPEKLEDSLPVANFHSRP